MAVILQVDFEHQGPFGDELKEMLESLAQSINEEPGMIWKIWTESSSSQRAGGIYAFTDEDSAQQYLDKHTKRLALMEIKDITGLIFDINQSLSKINQAPIT